MADEDTVKGGKELAVLAEKGMALFAAQEAQDLEGDVEAASAFKAEADAKHAALETEAAALTGKDNKKARQEKSKEAAAVKTSPEYIDACRVIKGQPPKNGNFVKAGQEQKAGYKDAPAPVAPAAEPEAAIDKGEDAKKKEKKPKKELEAGISKAERDELEKLKTDIITRKKELKESGMSGGQINKDEEVARMVARMNELKEKENPGCLAAAKEEKKPKKALSAEKQAEKETLEKEIEEYRLKLKTEFGYSNKDIKADPDLADMTKRLNDMK